MVLHSVHFEILKLPVDNGKFLKFNEDDGNWDIVEFLWSWSSFSEVVTKEMLVKEESKHAVLFCVIISWVSDEAEDSNSEEVIDVEDSYDISAGVINDALDCDLVITGIL